MNLDKYIKNYKSIKDVFGYLPSFHDAEIKGFIMNTYFKKELNYSCPIIEFTVHCWEMTNEIDNNGYYIQQKHNLVTFRFEDIYNVELDGYNNQNVVSSIDFKLLETNEKGFTPIQVEINPNYGLGGSFKALTCSIVSVISCNKVGNVLIKKK